MHGRSALPQRPNHKRVAPRRWSRTRSLAGLLNPAFVKRPQGGRTRRTSADSTAGWPLTHALPPTWFTIAPQYRSRGYVTEAVRLLVGYLFARGKHGITVSCDARNASRPGPEIASRAVTEPGHRHGAKSRRYLGPCREGDGRGSARRTGHPVHPRGHGVGRPANRSPDRCAVCPTNGTSNSYAASSRAGKARNCRESCIPRSCRRSRG